MYSNVVTAIDKILRSYYVSTIIGLSSNVDGDGFLWVCLAITSSNTEIVGAIVDITGHHHRSFLVPLPILGVWDVDGVVVTTFRVVDNETDRCVVSIILASVGDPSDVSAQLAGKMAPKQLHANFHQ